jgi:hypothetical protein
MTVKLKIITANVELVEIEIREQHKTCVEYITRNKQTNTKKNPHFNFLNITKNVHAFFWDDIDILWLPSIVYFD